MLKIKLILLFFIPVVFAYGQEPFEILGIKASVYNNFNKENFHNYWNGDNGYSLSAKTPFYYGFLFAGAATMKFNSLNEDLPDYRSIRMFLAFGKDIFTLGKITLFGGVKTGMDIMRFDKSSNVYVSANEEMESEVFLSGITGLTYRFSERFSIDAECEYSRLFTREPIDLLFIGGGINYYFNTPGFIKDFLK